MYCYLEKFKKENSRWCARNEIPVTEERYTSCGDKEYYKVPEMYRIDWYNIGKIRFDLKYNHEDSKEVRLHYVENVNRAVEMMRMIIMKKMGIGYVRSCESRTYNSRFPFKTCGAISIT